MQLFDQAGALGLALQSATSDLRSDLRPATCDLAQPIHIIPAFTSRLLVLPGHPLLRILILQMPGQVCPAGQY